MMGKIDELYVVHDKLLRAYHVRHVAALAKLRLGDEIPETACLSFDAADDVYARMDLVTGPVLHNAGSNTDKGRKVKLTQLAEAHLRTLYDELEQSLGDEALVVATHDIDLNGIPYRTHLVIPFHATICAWYDEAQVYPTLSFSQFLPQGTSAKRFGKAFRLQLNVITFAPKILSRDDLRSWLKL